MLFVFPHELLHWVEPALNLVWCLLQGVCGGRAKQVMIHGTQVWQAFMAPFNSGFEDHLCMSLLFLLVSAMDNVAVVSPQLDDSFPKSDQAFDGPALTCVGSAILECRFVFHLHCNIRWHHQ